MKSTDWYRVGVVFKPLTEVRYLKDKHDGTWYTTKYRYVCRLFSMGEALGIVDHLNSKFNASITDAYAFLEEVP